MKTCLALAVLLAVLVAAWGEASAESHANVGVARVDIEDQRSGECHDGWIAVCQVDFKNVTDPGTGEVDASQNISYVGVGASVDSIAPVGADYKLRGEDGYVPNPLVPFLADTWTSSPLSPGLPGVFELAFNGDNDTVTLETNYVDSAIEQQEHKKELTE